jgi:hypothetical protein
LRYVAVGRSLSFAVRCWLGGKPFSSLGVNDLPVMEMSALAMGKRAQATVQGNCENDPA